jgi:hypothetical protein
MKKEEKIVTRTFQYGDEKESSWPPKYGSRDAGSFYWDKETQTFKRGYPPNPNPKHGTSAAIIMDTIDPYYHPASCTVVESRSRLKMIDKACGTITTDKPIPADPSWQKEREAALKKDRHEALHKAVAQLDAGTAPLSEETREMCRIRNETVSRALGIDAFNAAGRINDPRGKRYKRLKRRSKPTT